MIGGRGSTLLVLENSWTVRGRKYKVVSYYIEHLGVASHWSLVNNIMTSD